MNANLWKWSRLLNLRPGSNYKILTNKVVRANILMRKFAIVER